MPNKKENLQTMKKIGNTEIKLEDLYFKDNSKFIKELEKITFDILPNSIKLNEFLNNLSKKIYVSSMSKGKIGQIYCSYNEILKHEGDTVFKLGESSNVTKRLKASCQLSNAPTIEILRSNELKNSPLAEDILFYILASYRLYKNRELFECDLNIIKQAFRNINEMFLNSRSVTYVPNILYNYKCSLIKLIRRKFNIGQKNLITSEINSFECLICNKIFNNLTSYNNHVISKELCNKNNDQILKSISFNKVMYKCDICSKLFEHKGDYKKHLNRKNPCKINTPITIVNGINGSISLACISCNKTYSSKGNLNKHLNSSKTCLEKINLELNKKSSCVEDINIAHQLDDNNNININTSSPNSTQTQKMLTCTNCNKIFSRKDSLLRHSEKYCRIKEKSISDSNIGSENDSNNVNKPPNTINYEDYMKLIKTLEIVQTELDKLKNKQ